MALRLDTAATRAVEVIRAGALTTVQDLGRPGHAHLGVGRGGALDPATHVLLNRLVGNPPDAATLETTLTGITLRPTLGLVLAVGGAAADVRIDGRPAAWGQALWVPGGARLDVGPARHGLRCYLAIAGGVAAEPVLGSRSADLLSGLGPAPLRDGDLLPVGDPPGPHPPAGADAIPWTVPGPAGSGGVLDLPIVPGPRADRITAAAWRRLFESGYAVAPASNRIALRLAGPPLERSGPDTVPSEGAVLGAVQVPADGRPILFLADHPTVGGYPVIGVVTTAGLTRAAQAAPGTAVRFRPGGRA